MKNCAISVASRGLRLPIFFKYPYSVKLFLSSGHSPWVTRLIRVQLETVHKRCFLGKLNKTYLSVFLTELKTYHLSYYIHKTWHYWHCWPSTMQYAGRMSYMNFVMSLAHHCLCGSVVDWSERGIRRKVQFLMRTPLSFLCTTFVTRQKKHLPIFPYRAQNLPSSIFYLLTL